jgi:hypothetical protein
MPTFTPEPSRPASCAETTALSFTGHKPPISSAYADGDNTNNKEAANTPEHTEKTGLSVVITPLFTALHNVKITATI